VNKYLNNGEDTAMGLELPHIVKIYQFCCRQRLQQNSHAALRARHHSSLIFSFKEADCLCKQANTQSPWEEQKKEEFSLVLQKNV
jgi:hypothetical protein